MRAEAARNRKECESEEKTDGERDKDDHLCKERHVVVFFADKKAASVIDELNCICLGIMYQRNLTNFHGQASSLIICCRPTVNSWNCRALFN